MLADAPQQEQMLGEGLFPLFQSMYPDLAGKITRMLLKNHNSALLHMFESKESLEAQIREAVGLLHDYQTKETQAQRQMIKVIRQEPLTASMLADAPEQEQKQMLGERLFPLIQSMHPDLAGKITGMLLEMENQELLHMLEFTVSLESKVREDVGLLHAHHTKETHRPLTVNMFVNVPQQEQKQMLEELLFPLIQSMHPELARKITGMLLEMENPELFHMLEFKVSLESKVQEAVAVLQAHQVKATATPSTEASI